ncbi:MAG TPA: hypothetical protein VFZ18_05760 [Longimicrobiaceae bacterium]
MTTRLTIIPRFAARAAVLSLLLGGAAACEDDPTRITRDDFEPELEEPVAIWIQDRWQGRDPLGQAAVQLRWGLPDEWDGEVFRVYARESGGGDYFLIATVTSCVNRECVYTDTNVVPGESYDYFVAAVDERSDDEIGESDPWQVTVPAVDEPDMPTGLTTIALDNGIFVSWASVGAEKYRVFLEGVDTDSVFFEIGATDATGYLDSRAENGIRYEYRVAAVGADGHVSRRSDAVEGIARPDYHAELIYTQADSSLASGFRFVGSEDDNPIVAGTSTQAQWRLESVGGQLRIVPLGQTRVTQGVFTTDLSCGPGSEPDCEFVQTAPAASSFGTTPAVVSPGNTYVFQVTDGAETHYGKIRVQGAGTDAAGRQLVVFDWAYQLVANEPSLNLAPAR